MQHVDHGALGSMGSIVLTLLLALTALVYIRGVLRLRSASSNMGAWRACAFLLGLVLIWIAVASRVAALDHELLSIHMVQHLLLMSFAPPLIWLGSPVLPLLRGLPGQLSGGIVRSAVEWSPLRRIGRALSHPAVCWLIACAVLMVWHVPAFFALGLTSDTWHGIEQLTFLVAGLLFWWPVIQPWPCVSRWPDVSIILYLLFATFPCDILAGFLVFCDRVVYPVYFSSSHLFGLTALEDQQAAGALMWTCVTVVYLVAGTILTTRLLSPQRSVTSVLVASKLAHDVEPQESLEVA
jgi:putative membrane protein